MKYKSYLNKTGQIFSIITRKMYNVNKKIK
jgi:hypothetical protein